MSELLHVGVLGMRWGRRRAKQNANLERHGLPQPKNNLSKYKNIATKLNDMRKESAKNALRKDIASLDKHGMKDQADALRGNLKKMESAKAKVEKSSVLKENVKSWKDKNGPEVVKASKLVGYSLTSTLAGALVGYSVGVGMKIGGVAGFILGTSAAANKIYGNE